MNQNGNQVKPQFVMYPKRKSSANPEATLYVRISYEFTVIDKSMGIKIPFTSWDRGSQCVMNNPIHQNRANEVFNEIKEKVMGAYYLLCHNTAQPTLREMMDLAFAGEEKKTYSLFGVFASLLLKTEKQNIRMSSCFFAAVNRMCF